MLSNAVVLQQQSNQIHTKIIHYSPDNLDDLMLMLGLIDTMDQLAMTNSVHLHCHV